ncbi:hypothetical protein D3C71_1159840 [compost metagenome]
MKKTIKVGQEVKVLMGSYKGQTGEVIKKGAGQYDVKMNDGQVRFFGINDIE